MENSISLANKVRRDVIEMMHLAHSSHVGSALSIVDILAVLYCDVMNVNKDMLENSDRDRFILSKGHAGAAVYATLAEQGFFPDEELRSYYSDGSKLSGHVSHKGVAGIEFSTGSLGHGISVATGMALAAKKNGLHYSVYVIVGNGECNEGTVWEAALFACQHQLDNLYVIIDDNRLQGLGDSTEILNMNSMEEKWEAFHWNVNVVDGHNHEALYTALQKKKSGIPNCIIANTIKGKGVSFMENDNLWHYRDPQNEFYDKAIEELESVLKK